MGSSTEAEDRKERQKAQARRLLEKQYLALGEKYQANVDEMFASAQQRAELDELWRLCGFGDPPEFAPTLRLVKAS